MTTFKEFLIESFTYQVMPGEKLYYDILYKEEGSQKRFKYLSSGWHDIGNEIDIVAKDGAKIVGIAGIQIAPIEKHVLWAKFVSVDPAYKNRKVATGLVREIFKYAEHHKLHIRISTYSDEGKLYIKKIFERIALEFPGVAVKDSTDHTKFPD